MAIISIYAFIEQMALLPSTNNITPLGWSGSWSAWSKRGLLSHVGAQPQHPSSEEHQMSALVSRVVWACSGVCESNAQE